MTARIGAPALLLPLLFAAAVRAEPPRVQPPPVPGPGDRCAVCGMFVSRYPRWVASVAWQDGTVTFFDGPKDLFHYLLYPERYRGRTAGGTIAEMLVTEYYSGAAMPARDAFYVVGSDVAGPMGREFVPVRSGEQAAVFRQDHQGRRILRFPEVTRAVLAEEQ